MHDVMFTPKEDAPIGKKCCYLSTTNDLLLIQATGGSIFSGHNPRDTQYVVYQGSGTGNFKKLF